LASRYITSFKDLPGGDPELYRAWNAGDIAHQLEGLGIDANPYDPETQGVYWRTWRRGWEGVSMTPIVSPPPPLQGPLRPIGPLIITRYRRWRVLWLRLTGRLH